MAATTTSSQHMSSTLVYEVATTVLYIKYTKEGCDNVYITSLVTFIG